MYGVWCMVYVGWSANASTQHNSLFILAVARMPVNTVRFANLAKRDWTICNTFCLFICIYLLHLYRFLLHLCRAINKNVHLTVVAHIDLERCSKFSSSFLAKSMTMTTMMKTLLNIDFTFQVRWTEACVQHLKSSIRIPFELINLMKVQVWISAKKRACLVFDLPVDMVCIEVHFVNYWPLCVKMQSIINNKTEKINERHVQTFRNSQVK